MRYTYPYDADVLSLDLRMAGGNLDEVRRIRVRVNAALKRNKLIRGSIPLLAPKRWARTWQTCRQGSCNRCIRKLQQLLGRIETLIGPSPAPFKLRPAVPVDARIRKLYPVHTTEQFWEADAA